jgi:SAM-dependent methyltransferase
MLAGWTFRPQHGSDACRQYSLTLATSSVSGCQTSEQHGIQAAARMSSQEPTPPQIGVICGLTLLPLHLPMNSNAPESMHPSYFAEIYQANLDPWNFETSLYEREKYLASLAALPLQRYRRAFEIGGSIGVLTRMLADRCDRLLSTDVSPVAQARAQTRCADQPQVEFQIMQFPRETPDQTFDLIVLSEVGYYLSERDLLIARNWIVNALRHGGHLLLVHWTPWVEDYPLTGDEVHDLFLGITPAPFSPVFSSRETNYRIDVLAR